MIYPVPTHSYKKKPKRKIPWSLLLILFAVAFTGFFLYYTHNLLFDSSDMTEPVVDFLFLIQDKGEVFFIRSNKQQKISYAVQMPLKSFEPIQAVSLDQSTPQGVYNSIEKLFGRANRSFWATIETSDFAALARLSKRSPLSPNTAEGPRTGSSESPHDIHHFIELVQQIDLSAFEFIFFPKMKALQDIFVMDNFNNRSAYRLVDQLKNFAYKATPVTFLTKNPVTIRYRSGSAEVEVERFYLDDKSLKSIKEFMSQ